MASFEDGYDGVPDADADPTNVWGLRQSELVQAAQLRSTAAMDSAKVAVVAKGTAVWLLQRAVLPSGACRVRVRTATGPSGWLTSKMLAPPVGLDPTKFKMDAEFVPGVTAEGVAFLRTRVGLCTADAPVLVVLHGTSYNAGVWIPTFEALHDLAKKNGQGFEAFIVEWTGHGRSRGCPPGGASKDIPDIGVDRYELTESGPDDVRSVLTSPGCAAALNVGRTLFAVAHSVGAQICCHTELKWPATFGGIVAIEPILFPPLDAKLLAKAAEAGATGEFTGLIKGTLLKRAFWEGEDSSVVREYLGKTAMGRQWEAAALDKFVEHGVVAEANGFKLRCDPVTEAAIYANSGRSSGLAFDRLGEISCPCYVCVGHDSTMNAPTASLHRDNGKAVAAKFGRGLHGELDGLEKGRTEYHGTCVVLTKADHYIPMENARWCAAFVDAALARYATDEYRTIPYYSKKPKAAP